MKRLAVSVVCALGVFLLGLALPSAAWPQQVTLLHVNDSHSHVAAWGPKDANLDATLGGLPRVATIVAAERAVDPNALFVHAGDFMDGDLFFVRYQGVAELTLLTSLGLDALILGNHEFAFKPDFLKSVLDTAWPGGVGAVPILGTNLDISNYQSITPWIVPTFVKDVNGVKVGFFGLTIANGALAKPAPILIDPNYAAVATGAVTSLRAAGAQVVVCISHFGLDAAVLLAQTARGIDVIVNGHDHAALKRPTAIARPGGGSTFIVSGGSDYEYVGRLRLMVNGGSITLVDYVLTKVDEEVPPRAAEQAAVEQYKAGIVAHFGDVYHQVLASAGHGVDNTSNAAKARRDTPLGNLFTDAYRASTGTDVAIEASGYLGQELPPGAVVGADVFRAMSYAVLPAGTRTLLPYRLVTFRTPGAALISALETTLAVGGDSFPQVSGLRMDYDSRLVALHRILLDSVEIGGVPLVLSQLYSVTVSEGVYKVLAGMKMPMQDVVSLNESAFDAASGLVVALEHIGSESNQISRIRDVAMVPGKEWALDHRK